MGKPSADKTGSNKRSNKKRKLGRKPNKQEQPRFPSNPVEDHDDPVLFGGDEEPSASFTNPEGIHRLLEPYTKDQLVGFVLDAVEGDASLVAIIRATADRDVSHRKVFVHGLGWDATRETLLQAFQSYGPVEDCNVIVDKATGRAKGYGFVLFRTRASAVKALKEPQKMIKNRMAHCQLASVGPVPAPSNGDTYGRKVYISNVHADAAPDTLKAFFSQFGEIESGPFGFDMLTGKSRGYAIFVYKSQEGVRRALEEPHKIFCGQQLHCRLANEHGQKGKIPVFAPNSTPTSALIAATPQPVLAAVAAAQNLALYNQNPAAYSALFGQNPLLAAAALNPVAAVALNPTAALFASQGQVMGGGTGMGAGASSQLGAYGTQTLGGLQGLHSYQGSQMGQSSSLKPSGSYGGFP